jgi:predicted transcriptional regulator
MEVETLHVALFKMQGIKNYAITEKGRRLQTRYAAARIDQKKLPLERVTLL